MDAAALFFFGMMGSVSNYWTLSGYAFDLEEKIKPMWDIFQRAIVKSDKYIKMV